MRLLALTDPEQMTKFIDSHRAESEAITKQVTEIMWYMRSLGREEAWTLSPNERKHIAALIESNVKRVNETKLPLL